MSAVFVVSHLVSSCLIWSHLVWSCRVSSILSCLSFVSSLCVMYVLSCQVVENSDAMEEILDADPAVLENRLSVLLRIEGAVETPQKLDYIISTLESRAGRSKGLDLSVNRMADP